MRKPKYSLDGRTGVLTVNYEGYPKPLLVSNNPIIDRLNELLAETQRKLRELAAHRDAWREFACTIGEDPSVIDNENLTVPPDTLEWEE